MAEISRNRKTTYYIGIGTALIGIILFLSCFVSFTFGMISNFSTDDTSKNKDFFEMDREERSDYFNERSVASDKEFDETSRKMGFIFLRALAGIILVGIGIFVARAGAMGTAGSGLILNPRRARQDLKPYSQMVGGMVGDVLAETGLNKDRDTQTIMLRCLNCQTLNEQNSKYCQNCGSKI